MTYMYIYIRAFTGPSVEVRLKRPTETMIKIKTA